MFPTFDDAGYDHENQIWPPSPELGLQTLSSSTPTRCWGNQLCLLQNIVPCPPCEPGFVPGTGHLHKKFCAVCSRGFHLPQALCRALPLELETAFPNQAGTSVWSLSAGTLIPETKGIRYRVFNNAKKCHGPPVVLFTTQPPELAWARMPPEWLAPDGTMHVAVAKGTIVPVNSLLRRNGIIYPSAFLPMPVALATEIEEEPGFIETTGVTAYAIQDFEARTEEELGFKRGDLIESIESVDDPAWLIGQCNNKEGLFPSSYVRFGAQDMQPLVAALAGAPLSASRYSSSGASTTTGHVSKAVVVATEASTWTERGYACRPTEVAHAPVWTEAEVAEVGMLAGAHLPASSAATTTADGLSATTTADRLSATTTADGLSATTNYGRAYAGAHTGGPSLSAFFHPTGPTCKRAREAGETSAAEARRVLCIETLSSSHSVSALLRRADSAGYSRAEVNTALDSASPAQTLATLIADYEIASVDRAANDLKLRMAAANAAARSNAQSLHMGAANVPEAAGSAGSALAAQAAGQLSFPPLADFLAPLGGLLNDAYETLPLALSTPEEGGAQTEASQGFPHSPPTSPPPPPGTVLTREEGGIASIIAAGIQMDPTTQRFTSAAIERHFQASLSPWAPEMCLHITVFFAAAAVISVAATNDLATLCKEPDGVLFACISAEISIRAVVLIILVASARGATTRFKTLAETFASGTCRSEAVRLRHVRMLSWVVAIGLVAEYALTFIVRSPLPYAALVRFDLAPESDLTTMAGQLPILSDGANATTAPRESPSIAELICASASVALPTEASPTATFMFPVWTALLTVARVPLEWTACLLVLINVLVAATPPIVPFVSSMTDISRLQLPSSLVAVAQAFMIERLLRKDYLCRQLQGQIVRRADEATPLIDQRLLKHA